MMNFNNQDKTSSLSDWHWLWLDWLSAARWKNELGAETVQKQLSQKSKIKHYYHEKKNNKIETDLN